MTPSYARAKWACYAGNITQAITGNIPPLLFITFHKLYNISYSLLGLLVLVFFFSQLTIDLIFSFFFLLLYISFLILSRIISFF